MCNCTKHFRLARIYKSLLRTLMLIIFGLANINSGLSSYPHKESGSTITSSNSFSDTSSSNGNNHDGKNIANIGGSSSIRHTDLQLNQNLIISHQTNTDARNISPNMRQLTKEKTIVNGSYSHSINENLIIDTNTEDGIRDRETSAAIFDGDDIYKTPMYFGTENQTVVTTQIGATAHIPCTIHHIGDGVVSWIRKKDYHLLTVGLTTYSSDERFSATHLKHSEDWTLQVKFVQLRDAGVYECQVSTHPPTSIFLHLNVVEARAEISGPPILYLTPGSQLRLQCRVVQNTEASEYIFWYHDNRMINYDIDRGINVSTETDFQSSELTILKTRREHSGNFTCVASNTQPASVLVHIFKADNPAAMYHGHVGSSTKSYQTHLHNIVLIVSIGYGIFFTYIYSDFV